MFRNFKVLLAVLAVLVIAGGAYAFAAANTIPVTAGGYEASVVGGYVVTDVVYDLDATDPTLVDEITFTVTGAADAAIVKLQTVTAGTWKDCTLGAAVAHATPITCTYGTLEFADVTAFNVVASSSLDPAP
jgi:hypothetical protein